ncbi:MAG: helix-turn-helix domain-containing protein [Oscillospiraceae bacterium]|nr:helix-turn-helix domain-containing protein [Oscillospiraceae bacterium]
MNVETANRLQQLRKKNNLSQEELAEKIGISRQAVSKWERAEASPDTDNLLLLAKLYGVSLDELLKTESVHFPDEDSISLRKEDYIEDPIPDDGEIYPNGRQEKKEESPQQTEKKTDDDDSLGGFVKNVAEFAVNVSKETISATSKAMKSANEQIKNGKSMEDSISDSFERVFENFGEDMEKKGEAFAKTMDKDFESIDNEFRHIDVQLGYTDSKKRKKSQPKSYPATLLDKLYPFIVVILFLGFCAVGFAHPMWMLFLTIPIYYILSTAYKKHRAGDLSLPQAVTFVFDGIVPFAAAFLFIAVGSVFDHWHIIWLIFLFIPIYYIFSAAVKKYLAGILSPMGTMIFFLNGSFPIIVTILFFLVGFIFSFAFSWVLFLAIPIYYITVDHFKKSVK